jgi:hypothetical protein
MGYATTSPSSSSTIMMYNINRTDGINLYDMIFYYFFVQGGNANEEAIEDFWKASGSSQGH